jgi:hypothetical protein
LLDDLARKWLELVDPVAPATASQALARTTLGAVLEIADSFPLKTRLLLIDRQGWIKAGIRIEEGWIDWAHVALLAADLLLIVCIHPRVCIRHMVC